MVPSMRAVWRRSSAGVSRKPFGSRAAGPLFLVVLAIVRAWDFSGVGLARLIADCPRPAKQRPLRRTIVSFRALCPEYAVSGRLRVEFANRWIPVASAGDETGSELEAVAQADVVEGLVVPGRIAVGGVLEIDRDALALVEPVAQFDRHG